MNYSSAIPHRKSIRLKNYNYSQVGLYFVTICTQNRECLFGQIINDEMVLNIAGRMIEKIWLDIPTHHDNTNLHEYIVMPNHFHAIIEIVGAESISARVSESTFGKMNHGKRADMESAPTDVGLSGFVQTFKRVTTIEYIKMVKQHILPSFDKKIWQRNYWEHIVRNDDEYHQISDYIINNPAKWCDDKLNGSTIL